MELLIDFVYLFVLAALCPKILYRSITQGRYRKGWANRFGRITPYHPGKKRIWIHAVSVGEVNATKTLIDSLKQTLPHYEIVLSTTTDTGFARANQLYSDDHAIFFFPMDFSFIMKRAFKRIDPAICLLMELEVWPNFAKIADKNNIPVVVVNGRLSDKSFPRYKLIKHATRWMFAKVSLVLAQSAEYAERFRYLGCDPQKVIVTNSLKYDTAPTTDRVEGAEHLASQLNIASDRLFVAGATGPSEEKILLKTFAKLRLEDAFGDLRLVIVPRKPERFDEVADLIARSGLAFVRYSRIKNNEAALTTRPAVILGDTMGDLRKFYSLAAIVFTGRSLCPMGGSDMMEPTAMAKCTIFGPHTFNFKQTVSVLLDGNGAIQIKDSDHLFDAARKCLTDTDYAALIAANGQKVIIQNQGATQKTIEEITKLLNPQS